MNFQPAREDETTGLDKLFDRQDAELDEMNAKATQSIDAAKIRAMAQKAAREVVLDESVIDRILKFFRG